MLSASFQKPDLWVKIRARGAASAYLTTDGFLQIAVRSGSANDRLKGKEGSELALSIPVKD